jgi:hypothetical protein
MSDNTVEKELPIEIKVFKNSAIITDSKIVGGNVIQKIIKTVKIEDFIKSFREAEMDYTSPILPSNCIKYKEKGNETIVMLLHEEARFNAICGESTYNNCVRPTILMVYHLHKDNNNYSISKTEAYGVKDSVNLISANTVLWGLPFPNIGTDGWVCWGSNSVAGTFKTLGGLKAYIERIFNSPFNSHLFNSASLHPYGIRSNHDLFNFLKDKDHFPYEILENLGSSKTVGSI